MSLEAAAARARPPRRRATASVSGIMIAGTATVSRAAEAAQAAQAAADEAQ